MPDSILSRPPQFRTAEYSGGRCNFCKQPLPGSYFKVNTSTACPACAAQVRARVPMDNHGAFVRALVFGTGGAIVGLVLYALFGIVTGLMIGYVALAVGWIVGKCMMLGSGGIGGRRYQIAAVLLTYAAVSLAAIPIYMQQESKAHRAMRTPLAESQLYSQDESSTQIPADPGQAPMRDRRAASPASALMGLALVGLASPFTQLQEPFEGIIGLVILFVGMQFAWKITRGVSLEILGPFPATAPAGWPGPG